MTGSGVCGGVKRRRAGCSVRFGARAVPVAPFARGVAKGEGGMPGVWFGIGVPMRNVLSCCGVSPSCVRGAGSGRRGAGCSGGATGLIGSCCGLRGGRCSVGATVDDRGCGGLRGGCCSVGATVSSCSGGATISAIEGDSNGDLASFKFA